MGIQLEFNIIWFDYNKWFNTLLIEWIIHGLIDQFQLEFNTIKLDYNFWWNVESLIDQFQL